MSRRSFAYSEFTHKGAKYRIGAVHPEIVQDEIVRLRLQLETYIDVYPDFKNSFIPVEPIAGAPPIALEMHRAAQLTGVGPLAAVAGAIAERAARAAVRAARRETERDVIVENGGDIFIISDREVVVSLYAGDTPLSQHLAFKIPPGDTPLAVCSSSATMGHSKSFGRADLVTVVAAHGALADAAATALCNKVRWSGDIDTVLESGIEIPGLKGILIVYGERVGMIGEIPELVRQRDPEAAAKITRSPTHCS